MTADSWQYSFWHDSAVQSSVYNGLHSCYSSFAHCFYAYVPWIAVARGIMFYVFMNVISQPVGISSNLAQASSCTQ